MNLDKLKEIDCPLVGRKEMVFKAGFTGEKTPSGEEVQKAVADKLKTKPELVEVDSIMQEYGSALATITVHVYNDMKALERFKGPQPKQKKKQG